MECVVVTPEATVFDGTLVFLALPLSDGEIGIGPHHAPMIGRLGYGEMRLQHGDNQTERFYIDGGFVQVKGDIVTVLTNRSVPAEKLDGKTIAEQLAALRAKPVPTPEALAARERQVAQARGQLLVLRHAGQPATASANDGHH
jgi:F-type H+-transporting ATPase subunit epsilon